jgi:hydrogenase maturation protease
VNGKNSVSEIAVLGLGNLMRTDDAVGMLTLEELRRQETLPPEVRLIEGGTLGIDLIGHLQGITHLVAVDAVDAGEAPGTLLRFSGEELAGLPASKSVHLLGFADLVGVMKLLNVVPREIVLLGIQPLLIDWGTELSVPVRMKRDDLIQMIVLQIHEWMVQTIPSQGGSSATATTLGEMD